MRPLRARLRGINHVDDLIELDLTRLPAGLVAVCGSNGAGKTTWLETLAPAALWLEYPSRPGSLRDRATRRDAFLELVQEYGGRTWRHLVNVDPGTGTSGAKVEPYLYELRAGAGIDDEDAWLPVDGYPTPGRVRDYQDAIAALFPRPDVFLASAFSVHTGRGNFLELPPAERRDLFVAMLGIEHFQRLGTRAAMARKPMDAALGELQELEAELARDRATDAGLALELAGLESRAAELEAVAGRQAVESDRARDELAAARQALAQLEESRRVVLERRDELETAIARAADRVQVLEGQIRIDAELTDQEEEIRAAATLAAELRATVDRLLADHRERKAKLEAGGRELTAARQEATRQGGTRERLDREISELEQVAATIPALELEGRKLEGLNATRAGLVTELDAARQALITAETTAREARRRAASPEAHQLHLAGLERDAALLEGVPCKGAAARLIVVPEPGSFGGPRVDCGSCQFLALARKAVSELPASRQALEDAEAAAEAVGVLEVRAAELRAAFGELEARRDELDQDRDHLRHVAPQLAQARARVARLEAAEAERAESIERGVELITTTIPDLEAAQEDHRRALEAITADGHEARTELLALEGAEARAQALALALARLPERRQALEDLEEELERSRAQLAALELPSEPTAARARLEAARSVAEARGAEAEATRRDLGQLREELGHARGRRQELGDLGARAKGLEAGRTALDRRRGGFRLLEGALGRHGLPALEIDAAGPTVSEIVNDLLEATYGGRFAVRLDTIREATDGRKARETFELMVLDGNHGGAPRAVGDLSKGERILIDEALKLGIAMFHARRSGTEVATLWRDECDGGLDTANRARYPFMLRRALEIGGFDRLFFISHHEEVQAQADAIIAIDAKGRPSVALQ